MNFTPKNFNSVLKKIGVKKNDNLFIAIQVCLNNIKIK